MDALKSNFEGYDIEKMELSETVEGKVYEFDLEKSETKLEVAINDQGTIVKKEKQKEEQESDND